MVVAADLIKVGCSEFQRVLEDPRVLGYQVVFKESGCPRDVRIYFLVYVNLRSRVKGVSGCPDCSGILGVSGFPWIIKVSGCCGNLCLLQSPGVGRGSGCTWDSYAFEGQGFLKVWETLEGDGVLGLLGEWGGDIWGTKAESTWERTYPGD